MKTALYRPLHDETNHFTTSGKKKQNIYLILTCRHIPFDQPLNQETIHYISYLSKETTHYSTSGHKEKEILPSLGIQKQNILPPFDIKKCTLSYIFQFPGI